jgi:hypothetical protein
MIHVLIGFSQEPLGAGIDITVSIGYLTHSVEDTICMKNNKTTQSETTAIVYLLKLIFKTITLLLQLVMDSIISDVSDRSHAKWKSCWPFVGRN